MSERHAGNAPSVLNFDKGNVTAQWNLVFDDWFTTVTTNVDDMPNFHADEWSKMFGTSTCNCEPDDEVEEQPQQPVQPITREIEDDSMDEEEALRQRMLAPNPLTQPNQPTTPPTRTYSQVTAVNQQSESPSREATRLPTAGPQPLTARSHETPARSVASNRQIETTVGPPSSVKKETAMGKL